MGQVATCFDNAACESLVATLKTDLVHTRTWPTRQAARTAIYEYLEVFYNRRRRHSSLGYRSPADYERRYHQQAAIPDAASPTRVYRTGSTPLVESAWAYQHRPAVGLELRERHQGLDPAVLARAWAAQLRLCGRFRRLAARKDSKNVAVTAIARELAGFVWAEMTA